MFNLYFCTLFLVCIKTLNLTLQIWFNYFSTKTISLTRYSAFSQTIIASPFRGSKNHYFKLSYDPLDKFSGIGIIFAFVVGGQLTVFISWPVLGSTTSLWTWAVFISIKSLATCFVNLNNLILLLYHSFQTFKIYSYESIYQSTQELHTSFLRTNTY